MAEAIGFGATSQVLRNIAQRGGGSVSALSWLSLSGFSSRSLSLYVGNFGSYNEAYGMLAGIVILMLYFYYYSSLIVPVGAE